jgi:antibiotic biosynthesis monooxygenase (ABM) superfamily enzyme
MTSPRLPGQASDKYFEYLFTHRVVPEHHGIFLRCQAKLRELVKKSPGFISVESTELKTEGNIFVAETLLRFDTVENLIYRVWVV